MMHITKITSALSRHKNLISIGVLCIVLLLLVARTYHLYAVQQNWQDSVKTLQDFQEILVQFENSENAEKINLKLVVVRSANARAVGLGGRTEVPEDGMLFLFPESHYWRFWMKGMLFDLDFVWLDQGRIVEITKNAQAPAHHTNKVTGTTLVPRQPINAVIELPAGQADAKRLGVGMKVELIK